MKCLRRVFDRWVLAGRPMVVRLFAGDVIVIEVTGPVGPGEEAAVIRRVGDAFGYRHEVLVLDSGTRLTVLTDMEGPGRL